MKKIFSAAMIAALLLNLFSVYAKDYNSSIFIDSMENLNKIYDKSDSFMVKVDTDNPEDMYRIYKTSVERQYIAYKTEKAISGYNIKAYNALGSISEMMDIYLSNDGENWIKSKYIHEDEAAKTEGWQWSYSHQKGKIPEDMYYIKIEFGDGVKTWNPQISEVEIYMDGLTSKPMAAESFETEKIPFWEYKNQKEAGVVFGMGMLKENDRDYVTRAEFSYALSVLLGMENASEDTSVNIPDVKVGSEYAGCIKMLVSQNIMPLYADGSFGPDEKISYEQAVKACANALGYGVIANSAAGLGVISGLGLTDGVEEEMSKDDAVRLLYNALNAKPVITDNGANPTLYIADESVLSKRLGLKKIKGQITAAIYGTLSGTQVNRSHIEVDGVSYYTEDDLIHNFLGYGVTIYINEDNEIKGYSFAKANYAPITVNFKDVINSSDSTRLYYYDNDKEKNIRIKPNYAEVNGENVYSDDWRKEISGDGQLKVIDSDDDGIYDTFLIEKYEFLAVKSVNAEAGIIEGKAKESLKDLNVIEYLTVIKNGKKAGLEEIKQNDSLTVARSKNNKYLKIYDRAAKKADKSLVLMMKRHT